jgi:excisionase family DNA binding protein
MTPPRASRVSRGKEIAMHGTHAMMRNPELEKENLRPLMDVDESAHTLCVSVRYVRLLLARGDLPVVRLGRRTLVRRTDVDAIIARGGLIATEAKP